MRGNILKKKNSIQTITQPHGGKYFFPLEEYEGCDNGMLEPWKASSPVSILQGQSGR